MNRIHLRAIAATLAAALTIAALPLGAAAAPHPGAPPRKKPARSVVYSGKLPDGRAITVTNDGMARIVAGKAVTLRRIPPVYVNALHAKTYVPSVLAKIATARIAPYVPNRVVVVFKSENTARADVATGASLTSDTALNRTFKSLGADRIERIARAIGRSRLDALVSRARSESRVPLLNIANAYRVHLRGANVMKAVTKLAAMPEIAYVAPDWTVTTLTAPSVPQPQKAALPPHWNSRMDATFGRTANAVESRDAVPNNFGLVSGFQANLDSPGTDAAAGYDEVVRAFGQLPGEGETITNVSLGDLTSDADKSSISNPCYGWALQGPTTHMINGQHYIDVPSLPLIPAYAADSTGNLSGSQSVCGVDNSLTEVLLDFSMMAPLPHDRQRPAEVGTIGTDLLGIAPGAKYRLVVPASSTPTNSDVIAAFLGAAAQSSPPDIITASIGFRGGAGFPGRYLEDDPLSLSAIQTIVAQGIVVCLSANDGTESGSDAAIGPSGGSAPTNLAKNASQQTSLADLAYSSAPSQDVDTGAIDVGGTTLDDIVAANPLDAGTPKALANSRTFPEVRWDGSGFFSSGYGSRVDISAPSDNIAAIVHVPGGGFIPSDYDTVTWTLDSGTSASAPTVAAVAAVALQVARLTGHPLSSPAAVRKLLVDAATAVPHLPQADTNIAVGPQVNLRRIVEKLLAGSGKVLRPGVSRVAILQRRSGNYSIGSQYGIAQSPDMTFLEDSYPDYIDLQGPGDINNNPTNWGIGEPITIAPDWENVPAGARYTLTVAGKTAKLSTDPYARLYPEQIFKAAGLPLASLSTRQVRLTYTAWVGMHPAATTSFTLTFGPVGATSYFVSAPHVPASVTGTTIPVKYDFSKFPASELQNPTLIVSYPGRFNPYAGWNFFACYEVPLTSTKGTVSIPVSALQGGGIYGIFIVLSFAQNLSSDYAYTRVTNGSDRPAAPTLSAALPSATPGHFLEIPYGASFKVSYDVSKVAKADGATLEVSAPGPTLADNANTFNNPNGTIPDANGFDSGSVARIPLTGTSGTVTLTPQQAALTATLGNGVRIIPTRGGTPVGEASDVSYVTMDGTAATDGGGLQNGYGVNANGQDIFYTSTQQLAAGGNQNSTGWIAQSTGAATQLQSNSGGTDTFGMLGAGLFGSDLGFYADSTGTSSTYYTVPGVMTASPSSARPYTPPTLPTTTSALAAIGQDQTGTQTAFLVYDPDAAKASQFYVYGADLASGTNGTVVNESAPLANFGYIRLGAFDYDPSKNVAYTAFDDNWNYCGTAGSTIVKDDVATGTVTSFATSATGTASGMAIDPASQVMAVTSGCYASPLQPQFSLVNLATQTSTTVDIPGSFPLSLVTADSANKLFLFEVQSPADEGVNNNAMSAVVVTDESGNVVKTIEQFNFSTVIIGTHYFAVNNGRQGWAFGPNVSATYEPIFDELEPFTY